MNKSFRVVLAVKLVRRWSHLMRRVALGLLVVTVTLLGSASLASAATSVTTVTFSPGDSSASAVSTWTVGFTSSSTGALAANATVTVVFGSSGTFGLSGSPAITFPSGFSGCAVASSVVSGQSIQITLANASGTTCSLAASTAATLTIAGIKNPAAGTYLNTSFSVATSADVTPTSPSSSVVITAATSVTDVAVTPGSLNAGATSTWSFGFTTSSTGSLSVQNDPYITVVLPSVFTDASAGPTITLSSAFNSCFADSSFLSGTLTVRLVGGSCSLAASTAATFSVAGIVNPTVQSFANTLFSLATSIDTTAANPSVGVSITSNVMATPSALDAGLNTSGLGIVNVSFTADGSDTQYTVTPYNVTTGTAVAGTPVVSGTLASTGTDTVQVTGLVVGDLYDFTVQPTSSASPFLVSADS
ncbi:MAG: hypothetical protein ACYCPT_11220, partial [Acidimicrobiales bacterium]